MTILTGRPWVITWPAAPAVYFDVGPKWTVPTCDSVDWMKATVGASRIHSADEREEAQLTLLLQSQLPRSTTEIVHLLAPTRWIFTVIRSPGFTRQRESPLQLCRVCSALRGYSSYQAKYCLPVPDEFSAAPAWIRSLEL